MWPILAITLILVRASISRTENLSFDSEPLRTAINGMNLNLNDEFGGIISSDDFAGIETAKYQRGDDPYKEKQTINQREDAAETAGDGENIGNNDDDDDDDGDDNRLEQLSALLTKLLREPGNWEAPLVLIEEPLPAAATRWPENRFNDDNSAVNFQTLFPAPWKRSRYYRRYPWKRQNSRSRYDYDSSRYLCTPTRDDVLQLLVALHDARQGNKSRTVNFCNRRRPAGSVFTNIRFLGRRK